MDLEKIEEKTEQLDETQKVSMFNSIVMGKDVTETIKTSRGDFKIKYPRSRDIQQIGRLQALRLNGIPIECFDKNIIALMQEIATLDVIVLEGPAWYENAKKENVNFSWGDIPLQSYIQEVYAAAYTFRLKVQKLLETNGEEGDKGMDSVSDTENNGSSGLFDGISSKS
ncbi:MAG: hypothetical protein J6W16_07255 [Methanobrevibacter sp.]|nr:hypothetical protein [Methanobrevibacter sp.]MBP5785361.1 hypothetical protein [Methanobrevibacter sp.]